MTHDDRARTLGFFLFGKKPAPGNRLDAKYRKEISRHSRALDSFRLSDTSQIKIGVGDSGDLVEPGLLRSPIKKVAHRDLIPIVHLATSRVCLPYGDESFGFRIRKRAQQHCVDDTKDRRIGPDA